MDKQTLQQVAAGLFLFWMALLVPWFLLAAASGMVTGDRHSIYAYAFVGSIWTYPISVGLVWKYRDDVCEIALLPLQNIAGWLIFGSI
jgi:hypothetical protein